MAFKYNPEAQAKYSPVSNNFLKNVTKEQTFVLASDKSGEYKIRILPPWSAEGIYAKSTMIHYSLGGDGKGSFVCPNMVEVGTCLFCNTYMSLRSEYDKFKADLSVISAKRRYYSNVLDMNHPSSGVLVFPFGIRIYKFLQKYQDSGDYGDITDLEEGRNLSISRTVEGKSVTDIVLVNPKISNISDYVSDDMLHNLDDILPEPDYELMEKSFNSHPWKVYNPVKKSLRHSVQEQQHEVDDEPSDPEEHKPALQPKSGTDKLKALDALEAKLKAMEVAKGK